MGFLDRFKEDRPMTEAEFKARSQVAAEHGDEGDDWPAGLNEGKVA